ncbi:MAG: hypothetical protein U0234_03365 [Sandaracinus sp.]
MFLRSHRGTGPLAIALWLAACGHPAATPSHEPPPSLPPPAVPSPPFTAPPTGPCATDAECRAQDAPACGCIPALASAPAVPTYVPCFAPPCWNHEAYCDVATHTCALRTAAPPPTGAAPASPATPDPMLAPVS